MRPDDRSVSFTFHKDVVITQEESESKKRLRQNLQDRFDKECPCSFDDKTNKKGELNTNKSVLSNISLSDPRKAIRSGAEKISKTFSNVRSTFGNLSQRFRSTTRRRQRLQESPAHNPNTPQSRARDILGRTPTKLYSPFGIETPQNIKNKSPKAILDDYEINEKRNRSTRSMKRALLSSSNSAFSDGYKYQNMNASTNGVTVGKSVMNKFKWDKNSDNYLDKENFPETPEKSPRSTTHPWDFLCRNPRTLFK